MAKKFVKRIAILFGAVVALFAVFFLVLSIFNSPTFAWRVLRYGDSDIGDVKIFPARPIHNGTTVSQVERSPIRQASA